VTAGVPYLNALSVCWCTFFDYAKCPILYYFY